MSLNFSSDSFFVGHRTGVSGFMTDLDWALDTFDDTRSPFSEAGCEFSTMPFHFLIFVCKVCFSKS
jgi:hypothetical protein